MGSNWTKQQGFFGADSGLQKVSEEDCCLDQPCPVKTNYLGERWGGKESEVIGLGVKLLGREGMR